MKAAKFIADKGWDLAQRDVVCLEAGFITKADFLEHYGFEILDEMKIYVDAWELVHKDFESVEMASYEHLVSGSYADPYWIDVKKAIALVKEVESLKEVS